MSDLPSDVAAAEREAAGVKRFGPDPAAMLATTEQLDLRAQAIGRAVSMSAGLLDAARVLVALAGVAAKSSNIPLGTTAVEIAEVALTMARRG